MTADMKSFMLMEPDAVRAYLMTIAAGIREIASPAFQGNIAARADQCSAMLLRIAQQVTPLEDAVRATLAEADLLFPKAACEAEGAVLDFLERDAADRSALIDSVTVTTPRVFDQARCEAYLRHHLPGATALRITNARPLEGGRAKLTVLLECTGQGAELPSEMVLRQDVPTIVPRSSVAHEYELLRILSVDDFKVPKPLWLERSADWLGTSFMLVTRVPGRTLGDLMSPPKSERLALQLAEQLGRLHGLAAHRIADLSTIRTKAFDPDQLRSALAEYRGIYDRLDRPSRTLNGAFSWLGEAIGTFETPRVLVHGDVGFHNILVHDADLTGILDWEEVHLGSPADDLGYCKADIEEMTSWPRFMQAYCAAGGPETPECAIDFYTLWGELRVYCMILLARSSVISGELRDLGVAACCINWIPALRHRMSLQLRALTTPKPST